MKETEVRIIQYFIDFTKSEYKTQCKYHKKMQDTDPKEGILYEM